MKHFSALSSATRPGSMTVSSDRSDLLPQRLHRRTPPRRRDDIAAATGLLESLQMSIARSIMFVLKRMVSFDFPELVLRVHAL